MSGDWAALDKVDPGRMYFKHGPNGAKYIVNQRTFDALTAAGYDEDDFLVSHPLPKNTAYQVNPELLNTGMEDNIGAHRRFLEDLGKERADAMARAEADAAYRASISAQYVPPAIIGAFIGWAIA